MAERKTFDSPKNLKNPLLLNATIDFPFEQLTQSALLVPQPEKKPTSKAEESEAEEKGKESRAGGANPPGEDPRAVVQPGGAGQQQPPPPPAASGSQRFSIFGGSRTPASRAYTTSRVTPATQPLSQAQPYNIFSPEGQPQAAKAPLTIFTPSSHLGNDPAAKPPSSISYDTFTPGLNAVSDTSPPPVRPPEAPERPPSVPSPRTSTSQPIRPLVYAPLPSVSTPHDFFPAKQTLSQIQSHTSNPVPPPAERTSSPPIRPLNSPVPPPVSAVPFVFTPDQNQTERTSSPVRPLTCTAPPPISRGPYSAPISQVFLQPAASLSPAVYSSSAERASSPQTSTSSPVRPLNCTAPPSVSTNSIFTVKPFVPSTPLSDYTVSSITPYPSDSASAFDTPLTSKQLPQIETNSTVPTAAPPGSSTVYNFFTPTVPSVYSSVPPRSDATSPFFTSKEQTPPRKSVSPPALQSSQLSQIPLSHTESQAPYNFFSPSAHSFPLKEQTPPNSSSHPVTQSTFKDQTAFSQIPLSSTAPPSVSASYDFFAPPIQSLANSATPIDSTPLPPVTKEQSPPRKPVSQIPELAQSSTLPLDSYDISSTTSQSLPISSLPPLNLTPEKHSVSPPPSQSADLSQPPSSVSLRQTPPRKSISPPQIPLSSSSPPARTESPAPVLPLDSVFPPASSQRDNPNYTVFTAESSAAPDQFSVFSPEPVKNRDTPSILPGSSEPLSSSTQPVVYTFFNPKDVQNRTSPVGPPPISCGPASSYSIFSRAAPFRRTVTVAGQEGPPVSYAPSAPAEEEVCSPLHSPPPACSGPPPGPPHNTPSQGQPPPPGGVSPQDLSSRLQSTASRAPELTFLPPIAPPKGVGGNNNPSYRLKDIRKVAYAAVPDLKVMPPPPNVVRTSPPPAPAPIQTPSPFQPLVQGVMYRPVYHHWFFKKSTNWEPFTMADSLNLEQAFTSSELNDKTKVATDGGRYDVEVKGRKKIAVFWEEDPVEVRRCSWFVRGPANSSFIPYDENIASLLEEEYKNAMIQNEWNRRVELSDGEVIILHGPNAIAHHQRSSSPDPWGNTPAMQFKPRVVKRGLDEFDIAEGEPSQVDHLLLVVHGIGKVCDLRFRSLVTVVDDFRSVSLGLIQSHFKSSCELGLVGRVEILPVEWHRALHTEAIDSRLNDITLPSIPKARQFTNETLLDILFYTSPVFCERIVQAVGAELNRVYSLYMERNPGFRGGVSLGAHSLGTLILFDMLCHQKPPNKPPTHHPQTSQEIDDDDDDDDQVDDELGESGHLGCLKSKVRLNRRMSYLTIGTAGTGQPYIMYPQLLFQPKAFFALGSPIGMFVTVRGIESLGEDFKFPTCPAFFNIFHPNDPVAYRIEPLISPPMSQRPAVLIPHHKGRKRMHLELKETMAHVTAALKQKIVESVRSTWSTVYQLAGFQKPPQAIEQEVDKVIEDEVLRKENGSAGGCGDVGGASEEEGLEVKVGCLNGGRRVDYVLQEAPLETFNQYISAVRSHVVYWESEDTMLMILKELYQSAGISADSQVPQPILPFDISSEDYADPGKAYLHYTRSSTTPEPPPL